MNTFARVGALATLMLGAPGAAIAQANDVAAALVAPADARSYRADREDATAAMAAENYAAAEPILERLTSAYPLDAETWTDLAIARRLLNKPEAAIAAYEHGIALAGPTYRRARYRIAQLQLQLERVDASLATLRQMVFEDAYILRPSLVTDPNFAALHQDPRFLEIAGVTPAFADREAGWRADLDFLVAEIRRLSTDYRRAELPASVMAIHADLYAHVADRSDEEMYAGISQLLGALNQNHTMMWGGSAEGGPDRPQLHFLPLQLYVFSGGVFVVGGEGFDDLIGAELVAVEGTPTEAVLTRVRTAMSAASPAEAAWLAPARLSDAALLNGLGLTQRSDRVGLRLRLPNGRIVNRTIQTAPMPILAKLQPPPRVVAQLFLARVQEQHWMDVWPDSATVYAQINQIAPSASESLADFGLRLRNTLAQSGARNLIIDLRNNNGGDTTSYPELAQTIIAFAAEDQHRVFVLIGRSTYSAAANLATDLERLADPIFVGEPTGNFGNQEGDEGAIRLPYSGVRGYIAGLWWQLGYPFDARRSIAPDVPVQLTAADYFAGRDPALEAVRALIREPTP